MITEENGKSQKNCFFRGVLGAILFSLICPIDWIIMDSFGMFGGILPILIPVAAFIGFRLFYGKITKTVSSKTQLTIGIAFFVVFLLTWYCFVSKEVFLSATEKLAEKGLSPISYFSILFDIKLVFSKINKYQLFVLVFSLLFGFMTIISEKIDTRKIVSSLIKYIQTEDGKNNLNKNMDRIIRGNFAIGVVIAAVTSIVLASIWFVLDVFLSTSFQIVFCILIPPLSLFFYRIYVRKLFRDKSDLTKDLIGQIVSIVISIIVVIVTWQSLFSVHVFANYTNWYMNGWVTSLPSVFDCFKPGIRNLYYDICVLNGESIWIYMDLQLLVLLPTFCLSFYNLVSALRFFFFGHLYDLESWGIRRKNGEEQHREDNIEKCCDINQQNSEVADSFDANDTEK